MKELRPYQAKSLAILSQSPGGLDASELGTGKTLVAVETVRLLKTGARPPRVLVVAPVNTHRQWRAQFSEQYPSLADSENLRICGTHKHDPDSWAKITGKEPGIFITGWEAMRGSATRAAYGDLYREGNKLSVKAVQQAMRDGAIPPWHRAGAFDLVIADEAHRMRSRTSLSRLVLKKIKSTRRLAISGTPAGNRLEDFWALLNWLWPDRYPSYWTWVGNHFELIERRAGRGTVTEIGPEIRPGSLWANLPAVVRWRVEDVLKELPPVVETVVELPMGPEQSRIYHEFATQALAWLDGHPKAAALPIERRTRLRQAALGQVALASGSGELEYPPGGDQPKLAYIQEMLSNLDANDQLLVWSHSAKWVVMAAQILNRTGHGPAAPWTGALTDKQRTALKASFVAGQTRVIVAQAASIAEGVDELQLACYREVWASITDDGVINQQARGRLWRGGQRRHVHRTILHSIGTIDPDVDATQALRARTLRASYGDRPDQ